MGKSATEVMQDIIVSAAIESVMALKSAARGMPNTLLRDINAIHANTTFGDLPRELQDSINSGVRAALSRLLKEGYAVAPREAVTPERRPPPRRDSPGGGDTRSFRGPRRGKPNPPRR